MWTAYDRQLGWEGPDPFASTPVDDGTAEEPSVAPEGIQPSRSDQHRERRGRRRLVAGITAGALVLALAGVGATQILGHGSTASASEAVTTAATQTIGAKSADMTMS